MKRIPVQSSNIASVGYDSSSMILEIEFHGGGVYQYFNIPHELYSGLITSSCIGMYFYQNIKSERSYTKVSSDVVRSIGCVSSIIKMMDNNSDFSSIQQEPVIRVSKNRTLMPDIICDYKGRQLIIEVKENAQYSSLRLKHIIDRLHHSDFERDAAKILLILGLVPKRYYEVASENGIEIWGLDELSDIFRDDLEVIQQTYLFHLLYMHSGKTKPNSQAAILSGRLAAIKPGRPDWPKYQNLCRDILEYLFTPPLAKPIYESSDGNNANRRDIVFPNYAVQGFWKGLKEKYIADFIVVDAKNYSKKIEKKEVLQIANYLKSYGTGLFGIIVSRTDPKESALITRMEQWIAYNKLIIFLNDLDLEQMLNMKDNNTDDPAEVIRQKIEDFRLQL
jgi:KTSC domain